MEIIDGIIAKIDRLKRLLELKDAKFEKLERLKKAREEDVQCLEKHIAELKEQNQKLSAQVEKHLEEKSNGNWAKEGAVVWDSEHKIKGVLLKHPNDNELHFVCFVPNSGIEDWPFAENSSGVEPYKGQDKEEVEPCYFSSIEKGDFLIESKGLELAVVVCAKFTDSFRAICVRSAKVDAHTYEKGKTYDFSKCRYLFENVKP